MSISTMPGERAVPPQTLFLDSNALIYMSCYLRLARVRSITPFCDAAMDMHAVRECLRPGIPDGIADGLSRGCNTLAYVQRLAHSSQDRRSIPAVYVSRLGRLEMLSGVLDGMAHTQMARECIPYRLRQRAREAGELVRMHLQQSDYDAVVAEMAALFGLIEDKCGVTIQYPEDSNQRDIAELAEFLQGTVFLDVVDCWIYSGAMVMQADELVTFDSAFASVVNQIRSGGDDSRWRSMRREVLKRLRSALMQPASGRPVLPSAPKLPKDVPVPWGCA
ncbi:MAG: hypothetical protein ACYC5O_04060 [Anaerolineae bacterium]